VSRSAYHKWGQLFFGCFEGDPFGVKDNPALRDREILLEKFAELKQNDYGDVIAQIETAFSGSGLNIRATDLRVFIDDLARITLVYNSPTRHVHASGLILYSVVRFLAESRPYLRILETGTARGFSSLTMAKALCDSGREGNIVTIDILPPEKQILWTGLSESLEPMTRFELLETWADLVERYITYCQMDSPRDLHRLGMKHIDFTYIDAMHDYESVFGEFTYIAKHQRKGDFVLFDDVGVQFPGVEQAIAEVRERREYVEVARFTTHYRPQPWLLCKKV